MSSTKAQEHARAVRRLIAVGVAFEKRHGFGVVPAVTPVKRVLKTGTRAAIRDGAASVLRRQQPVKIWRASPVIGDFAAWLNRRAA